MVESKHTSQMDTEKTLDENLRMLVSIAWEKPSSPVTADQVEKILFLAKQRKTNSILISWSFTILAQLVLVVFSIVLFSDQWSFNPQQIAGLFLGVNFLFSPCGAILIIINSGRKKGNRLI